MIDNTLIEFENVTKVYPLYNHVTGGIKSFVFNFFKAMKEIRTQQFVALKNINFTIKEGETVGIVGRNGAGKSTLLGLIAGVLHPTHGNVNIKKRVSPLLQLGGGFHPELTGFENIELNGVLMGLSRKQVSEKREEIIDFSELGEFIHQPVRMYSSGMMARLGFSVVAHLEPEILLIDEVLSVGDINFRKKCEEKMMAFKNKNVTMVLVSHSAEEVKKLCERAIWIKNHEIVMDGKSTEVLGAYHLEC